ncbi:hypothetical protein FZI85_27710 [Mycobacterium sp. CBMA293]|uniref:Uncharacterized protein n=1 Tax=Mycolicibacterium sp. CBMA 213 TaxID=1968788 RepID=A0A1S6GKT8_9MYCO|nr:MULTISPECIES: hypothetical protein [unclassified Mycolicibacterium]AQS22481.1 hypothetical protein pCBMA213_2_00117 [Mycolicibacterium sp. CBMA 213]MUL48381.1 hypothetical protein [Mycolicibacterium sp. CBMA 360]MUL62393.1 hypothetical protein [Mycolicibacterium sp. CBMA 335]MUM04530.1 hypothetical protein [Mycolicibacterium sp. CBMA 213]MUM14793.1 hypothetical protein [Mycolicibacterium sp. CBMA 293]
MHVTDLHIGQIVHPADDATHKPDAPSITGGIVVALNRNDGLVALRWVDYRGPHPEDRIVHIEDLRDTEPQRTPWWNRRTAEHQCFCGTPTLTIRNLRVSRHNTEYSDVDLWFHTVHDANAAIRLIAEAQNPFHSRLRRDRRSNLKGALTTSTKWPSFADVYEIYRPLRVA